MHHGVGHIYVPGRPYERRMARGVERVVPMPVGVLRECRAVWETLGPEFSPYVYYPKYRRFFQRRVALGPRGMRRAGQVHMIERGAHPFLVSLVTGATIGHVLSSKFERDGEVVWASKINAIKRATDPLRANANVSVSAA